MPFPELEGHPGASVVLLHAHPDDETLATGGLMARLVDLGHRVVLITGTRGERGEVVPGPLKHLEGTPELADVRSGELSAAMRALGVDDHRFLGGATARAAGLATRRYSDSGMQWAANGSAVAADDAPADAFSLAPLDEVVADTLAVIDEVAPRLLVSYDAHGGYGHPDHVRMHDAALEASRRSGIPLYAIVPDWNGDADAAAAAAASASASAGDLVVPLGEHRAAKFASLAAHATQLTVDGGDIVLSGGQRHTVSDAEVFRREFPPADGGRVLGSPY